MRKADYTYTIENGIVKITDLNLGNVSVTNDAENVITEIQKETNIKGLKIVYRDSEGNWDEIIPNWSDNICVYVTFNLL
jgi:hypothetical protein